MFKRLVILGSMQNSIESTIFSIKNQTKLPAEPVKIIIAYVPSELQLLFNDTPNDANLLKIGINYKLYPPVEHGTALLVESNERRINNIFYYVLLFEYSNYCIK